MKRFTPFLILTMILIGQFWACGDSRTEEELLQEIDKLKSEEKLVDATKTMEAFIEKFPESPKRASMMKELAILYVGSAKDYRKAIEIYQAIQNDYAADSSLVAQCQFMTGYIYANDLHEYDNARREYEKFLEAFPNNELADDVAWELENLGKDISQIRLLPSQESPESKQTIEQ
ncbi:MAG: tetratricopeptide repeat protein [Deferribacteres bacterium]|nr:tetratricopeptide repeat protein [candidate division KSB1 bacterium]MCB9510661.1 tetratricopeptide repeat protein [Deferribacteres bacterium]